MWGGDIRNGEGPAIDHTIVDTYVTPKNKVVGDFLIKLVNSITLGPWPTPPPILSLFLKASDSITKQGHCSEHEQNNIEQSFSLCSALHTLSSLHVLLVSFPDPPPKCWRGGLGTRLVCFLSAYLLVVVHWQLKPWALSLIPGNYRLFASPLWLIIWSTFSTEARCLQTVSLTSVTVSTIFVCCSSLGNVCTTFWIKKIVIIWVVS